MISILEKIKFFKENLELFDDDMDKYKYLLDQAKTAKKFPEEFRQDRRRHRRHCFGRGHQIKRFKRH